jgi:hypothetical protein
MPALGYSADQSFVNMLKLSPGNLDRFDEHSSRYRGKDGGTIESLLSNFSFRYRMTFS